MIPHKPTPNQKALIEQLRTRKAERFSKWYIWVDGEDVIHTEIMNALIRHGYAQVDREGIVTLTDKGRDYAAK